MKTYAEINSLMKLAYADLRKQGYICRSNFRCCQTCGGYAISQMKKFDENNPRYVFWHQQDTEHCKKPYGEDPYLYLSWAGDGHVIVSALREHGLDVEWNGKITERIKVK